MRGANGDSRAVNNALETISAAATAIASADSRAPQATVQVQILYKIWPTCFSFNMDLFVFSLSDCVNLIDIIGMMFKCYYFFFF